MCIAQGRQSPVTLLDLEPWPVDERLVVDWTTDAGSGSLQIERDKSSEKSNHFAPSRLPRRPRSNFSGSVSAALGGFRRCTRGCGERGQGSSSPLWPHFYVDSSMPRPAEGLPVGSGSRHSPALMKFPIDDGWRQNAAVEEPEHQGGRRRLRCRWVPGRTAAKPSQLMIREGGSMEERGSRFQREEVLLQKTSGVCPKSTLRNTLKTPEH